MLTRKITEQLHAWKADANHKPLIIKGCRQCGKTFAVMNFATENYKNVVYVNFFENLNAKEIFAGSLDVDNIVLMASAFIGPKAHFTPHETVIVLDEIQECPQARTALKFFALDGRYDVIATGSLLGVAGYGEDPTSIPVGYETVFDMHPLDFEEFCWANGITGEMIQLLRNLFSYKGAIFENAIADVFSKMGRKLYYYHKDSGLELDFLIRLKGKCVPVEVKAKDGNAKSVKTVLSHPEKYHVEEAIKLSDQNVGRAGAILTLPHYMAFLLTER